MFNCKNKPVRLEKPLSFQERFDKLVNKHYFTLLTILTLMINEQIKEPITNTGALITSLINIATLNWSLFESLLIKFILKDVYERKSIINSIFGICGTNNK